MFKPKKQMTQIKIAEVQKRSWQGTLHKSPAYRPEHGLTAFIDRSVLAATEAGQKVLESDRQHLRNRDFPQHRPSLKR